MLVSNCKNFSLLRGKRFRCQTEEMLRGAVLVLCQLRRERREVYNVTVTKGRVGL